MLLVGSFKLKPCRNWLAIPTDSKKACQRLDQLAGAAGLFGTICLTPSGPMPLHFLVPSHCMLGSNLRFSSCLPKSQEGRPLVDQNMAGAAGFEPAHDGIKTRCLTAWLRPNFHTFQWMLLKQPSNMCPGGQLSVQQHAGYSLCLLPVLKQGNRCRSTPTHPCPFRDSSHRL